MKINKFVLSLLFFLPQCNLDQEVNKTNFIFNYFRLHYPDTYEKYLQEASEKTRDKNIL